MSGPGNPRPGVVWDASVGRFREGETGRFVSRETAVGFLRWDERVGRARDSAGRFVPMEQLAPTDRKVLRLVNVDVDLVLHKGDVRSIRPASNQDIVERIVYRDPQGGMHVEEVSAGYGTRYDPRRMQGLVDRKAAARIKDKIPSFTTDELGALILRRDFIVRTTVSR